jgi:hypothetical protein
MPESPPPPPNRGPVSDERVLEALLSGQTCRIPEALVPVAGAIDALRAAPLRGELAGEDAARAAFRAATSATVPVPRADGAEHGTVTARTLVFSPGDREQRSRARHRRRRRTGARVARPLVVAVGAAGVIVIAVAVALTGMLPSSFTQTGNRASGASTSAPGTAAPSISQRVEGAASMEPTGRPTPATSTGAAHAKQNPAELCRQYYAFFEHAEPPSSFAAEAALRAKLNALVGNPTKVFSYCVPYLGYLSVGNAPGRNSASPPDIYSGGVGATSSPAPDPSKGDSGSGKSTIGKPGTGVPGPGNQSGQTGFGQG